MRKRSFEKYLVEVKLVNVRAFAGQRVTFDFPVTAVIGTNGGGKSTILGAAAIAYKEIKPGDFFPKSNVGDASMADWRVEFDLIDRTISKQQSISRNARFVSAKWRRENLVTRDVVVIPIQRTVPASEQTKYKRFIGIYQKKGKVVEPLPEKIRVNAGRILGKDLSEYKVVRLSKGDSNYLLLGKQKTNDFSQFHFGAGEASVIDMVSKIERSSEQSLILIEELENGLHPVATEKMTEYLIDVAKRKKSQVIFTTHSEYALKALPPQAIWACIDGQAYQGKLSIESLRAIKGVVDKEMAIFVEDEFSKDLLLETLRQLDSKCLEKAEVHVAGGYPYVVEVMTHHNKNPAVKTKALAVVDGDADVEESDEKSILKLPGDVPEDTVFSYIHENSTSLSSMIQQRCQCPQVTQDQIVKALDKVSIDTTDPHLYFSKLGDSLGFVSELIARRACISIYVQYNKVDLMKIPEAVEKRLEVGQ